MSEKEVKLTGINIPRVRQGTEVIGARGKLLMVSEDGRPSS